MFACVYWCPSLCRIAYWCPTLCRIIYWCPHYAVSYPGVQHYAVSYTGVQHYAVSYTGVQHYAVSYTGVQNYAVSHTGVQHYVVSHSGVQHYAVSYTGVQHYAVSYVFTFLLQCCDTRYVFSITRFLVHSYPPPPPFFVGGLISYACYLCLFVSSDIQHVLTTSCMAGVLSIKDRSCLPFASTCMVHPRFLGSELIIIFLLVFVMFVFVLWLVRSKKPVFLYCPFLISPSIFLNVDSTRCERLRSA